MPFGTCSQAVAVVSLTATDTDRYVFGSHTRLCRTTSSKNQDDATIASTAGDCASACFAGAQSSRRKARLIAADVTPCSS